MKQGLRRHRNQTEQQKAYELALLAIRQIEADLCAVGVCFGRASQQSVVPLRFYRNGRGELLSELNQVVAAFLADDLTVNGVNVCGKQLEVELLKMAA